MMTIPFKDLMRYEVNNDEDYYIIIQLYDEREDCYKDLISNMPDDGTEWIDKAEMIITDIDEVENKILKIRKKYCKLVKKFNR